MDAAAAAAALCKKLQVLFCFVLFLIVGFCFVSHAESKALSSPRKKIRLTVLKTLVRSI